MDSESHLDSVGGDCAKGGGLGMLLLSVRSERVVLDSLSAAQQPIEDAVRRHDVERGWWTVGGNG